MTLEMQRNRQLQPVAFSRPVCGQLGSNCDLAHVASGWRVIPPELEKLALRAVFSMNAEADLVFDATLSACRPPSEHSRQGHSILRICGCELFRCFSLS